MKLVAAKAARAAMVRGAVAWKAKSIISPSLSAGLDRQRNTIMSKSRIAPAFSPSSTARLPTHQGQMSFCYEIHNAEKRSVNRLDTDGLR
jgi:hypothetical protein